MKKKLAAVIVFVIVLVFPMVSWPIVSQLDLPTVEENREKAAFPQWGNDVFSQFDAYFADRAPYRDLLIKSYKSVELQLQLLYQKLLPEYYTTIEGVIIGQQDWLFYTQDNSVGYYKGTNLPTEEKLRLYVERAEKVNEYFKSQGKELVILIAPNKEQVYSEYMPSGIRVTNETKRLDVIYNYFKQHSDVKMLYPKDELVAAKEEHDTYLQQDTHWNDYGAYIGAKAIFEALNMPVSDSVEINEITWSGGDLANMAALTPAKYVGYDVAYRPQVTLEYTRYSKRRYQIVSSNKNGRTLFVLGDSFTLAGSDYDVRVGMKETLAKEYENTVVVHRDDFNAGNRFSKEFNAADTVIIEAVERYDTFVFSDGGILQKIIDIYGL